MSSDSLHTALVHNDNLSKDTALDALHSFLDGELCVSSQPALFAHLATCSSCREELEGVMKFRRMSRMENLTVPPALDAALFKRLQKHKAMIKKIDRAGDRRPLWNARAAVSLRATVVTAMLIFLTGLLIPANDANLAATRGTVTASDEFIEFADLDLNASTSTVYVFYPGLTIEEAQDEEQRMRKLP